MLDPFNEELVQPASYELTFDGSKILRGRAVRNTAYDLSLRKFIGDEADPFVEITCPDSYYYLEPGEFYIASSIERLCIPSHLMSRFEGKSTLGRAGLMVHVTAGYIDPGFEGTLTLEMKVVGPWSIVLRHGDKIGQLSFHRMSAVPDHIYGDCGNHYQGQSGPTPCR